MPSKILLSRLELFTKTAVQFPEFCYLGNPILRHSTEQISVEEGKVIGEKLGQILVKYRQITGYGRGLSANQIGISKSVFVTFLDNQIQTYINPKIIKFSADLCLYHELCLSSGIFWADIKRPAAITFQWTNESGQSMQKEFSGPLARLLQHETEHLNGLYSLDHAEPNTLQFCLSDPLLEKIRSV